MYFLGWVGCQDSSLCLQNYYLAPMLWPVKGIFSVCLSSQARFILGHWAGRWISNFDLQHVVEAQKRVMNSKTTCPVLPLFSLRISSFLYLNNNCVLGAESLKPRCWWFCRKGWLCVRYKTAALINDDCDECWKQGGAMSCGFVNHLSSRTGLAPIQDWHLIDQEASWIPNQPCRDCFYWELGESLCMSFSPHGSFINCFIWGRNIWKIK